MIIAFYFRDSLTKRVRNSAFWRYFCNYFPLKLVKTVDLDPTKSYLFISVPHGILSIGVVGSFATDVLGCKKLFPGLDIRIITLDQHFKIPLFREYPYLLGKKPVSSYYFLSFGQFISQALNFAISCSISLLSIFIPI